MLGIFIVIVGLVVLSLLRKRDEGWMIAGVITIVVGCIMSLACVFAGIYTYPDLVAQRHEIAVLQNRIEDVRNATYSHKDGGSLISGSIENLKQSTNLTEFIEYVARRESRYDNELGYYKTAKMNYRTQLFSVFFVSDEVNTLPFMSEQQTNSVKTK